MPQPAEPNPVPALSELEGAVLGLLHRGGPLTAHAVRQVFLDSPTDHFSGSAGAIYPLVRRLERAGLIEAASTGAKGGRAFALTGEGRRALRAWVRAGDPSEVAGVTFDPLRTRVLALGALRPAERKRFLARVERELERLVDLQPGAGSFDDEWSHAACEGAASVMRARLAWVRQLRASLARR